MVVSRENSKENLLSTKESIVKKLCAIKYTFTIFSNDLVGISLLESSSHFVFTILLAL